MTQPMILTVIIQSILFGIGLFKIYTDMQVKLSELEIRLKSVEKQDDEIYTKLDKIMDKLTTMQINIENKQNRD
jgi:chaperonin cofactor prefoldin